MIWGLAYAVAGMLTVALLSYLEELEDPVVVPALVICLWPLIAPVVIGAIIRKRAASRKDAVK